MIAPRILLLAAPLLLAACQVYKPPQSPPGTVARACEDAADADPRLKTFARTHYVTATLAVSNYSADYFAYRSKLIGACLDVRGGRPSGGVEKPIR